VALADEIGACMVKNNVSVEKVVQVLYQPQAVFRVRPVAHCSATMAGEYISAHSCAPALLSTSYPLQSPTGPPLPSHSTFCSLKQFSVVKQTLQTPFSEYVAAQTFTCLTCTSCKKAFVHDVYVPEHKQHKGGERLLQVTKRRC
jgi:hypothetical protein